MDLRSTILKKLKSECSVDEYQWITEKLDEEPRKKRLGFVMAHRFVSDERIRSGEIGIINSHHTIDLSLWSRDQLCRALLLLSLDNGDRDDFHEEIETLFQTADNRESEALYSSIPFFNYPESWKDRASEAIRSNVGLIFDAMAFNNPYPSMYLDETAWNQMVLKTIFSNKSIWRITGLEERRNKNLAQAISDFAHERWAAKRTLPPEVWFLTAPFPGKEFWQDTVHLLSSDRSDNQEAGYLLWKEQASDAPTDISKIYHDLFNKLDRKNIKWANLALSDVSD